MNTVNIIRSLSLLMQLSSQFAGVVREWHELIEQARAEGRDISDEELRDLRQRSKSALDRWIDE